MWSARPLAGGCTVELEDLSSRLGLNWVRKELLESLGVLKPGHSAQELQQFREDAGIHLNLKPAFLKFFSEDELDRCSPPIPTSISISQTSSRCGSCTSRGGNWRGGAVPRAIQRLRIEKKIVEPPPPAGSHRRGALPPAAPAAQRRTGPESALRTGCRAARAVPPLQLPSERAESILVARPTGVRPCRAVDIARKRGLQENAAPAVPGGSHLVLGPPGALRAGQPALGGRPPPGHGGCGQAAGAGRAVQPMKPLLLDRLDFDLKFVELPKLGARGGRFPEIPDRQPLSRPPGGDGLRFPGLQRGKTRSPFFSSLGAPCWNPTGRRPRAGRCFCPT